jgi:hypothetical protein
MSAVGLAVALISNACASIARPVAATAAACLDAPPVLWALRGADRRTLQVRIDAAQGTRDGWQVDGKRRLVAALSEWNAVGLPVRLAAARAGERLEDVTVLIVPRLPTTGDDAMSRYHAGVTHLTYLATGEITRALVLVAEETPGGKDYSIADQMSTLVHELGHALGLPHATNTVSVMSPRPIVNGVTRHDERLARSIYAGAADPCRSVPALPHEPGTFR